MAPYSHVTRRLSACVYSSHQEYELWLPPGALNNFAVQFDASDAAAVNTANTLYNGGATGCCVCESGCDHSLETHDGTNGQCGLANDAVHSVV